MRNQRDGTQAYQTGLIHLFGAVSSRLATKEMTHAGRLQTKLIHLCGAAPRRSCPALEHFEACACPGLVDDAVQVTWTVVMPYSHNPYG